MADSLSNLWNRLQSGSQLRLSAVDRDALKQRYPERAAEIDAFFETLEQAADQSAAEMATAAMPEMDSSNDATLPPRQQPAASAAVDEDAVTLPPVQSSDPADKFATVIPINQDNDATLAPAKDATNVTSAASAGSRVRYFGDYELLSEIARGGMGVVYKARQVNLNRVVALKMILAGNLASEEDVQRFRTEAEAAANLDHSGIVPIYEIGLHEGQHFFSMGYVDGCSLADRVRNGPLPPKEAAELTKKIAEAIAFAHSRNVIHRDLKPANVLLDQNGEPKVTDFGLARKTDNDSGMTRTGAVMGTPSYMPPEQAAGKTTEVGPLSDVYSLGAILYCLLTGRPPFQAANPIDTLMQVMEKEPVSVSTLNPEIQRDLETICHKALQKEPKKRYESAKALADDLGRWQKGEPIKARAVSRTERVYRWIKRNKIVSSLLAATAMAMILGTTVSAYFAYTATAEAKKAHLAERKSGQSELLAKESEQQAKLSEKSAIASRDQTEATLARSNYFLAQARWDKNRAGDGLVLLQRVPETLRNFEWYLARRQFDGSDFVCYGHEAYWRSSVCFSPDGKQFVSAGGELTLWDATTGDVLRILDSDSGSSVSFSRDGTRIVSGSPDNTIKLWDATTGEQLLTLQGHSDWVNSVSISPDGTRIASGSNDQTVKLWDAGTGVELNTLQGHSDWVNSVSFSPDGTRIASGSGNFDQPGEFKLWDAATGEELRTLKGHTGPVYSVTFSPDGTRIASGSNDQTVKIWDASTGVELFTLKEHTGGVRSVCFTPDGTRIASGSSDQTVKIWDASTGVTLNTHTGHSSAVNSLSISPDGTRIVSGGDDRTIKLWDATNAEERHLFRGHSDGVMSLSFSPDSMRIASGSVDKTIKLWDAATGDELDSFTGHKDAVISVTFSPDGTRIASGSMDKTIKLWDAATGDELGSLTGHKDVLTSVTFSPDGTQIASGSMDGTVKLWDAATSVELKTLKGHKEWVSVSFSPDGTRLASASDGGTIRLWDITTGEKLSTFKDPIEDGRRVICLSFSPDGTRLASAAGITIDLLDAATGELLSTLTGHTGYVTSVSFSPDGTRLASGSTDQSIKLWDAGAGEELSTLKGRTGVVRCVSFSPDGTQIASGNENKTISLWDASQGEELRILSGLQWRAVLPSVSFSPDGLQMLTSDQVGTLTSDEIGRQILWDTETGTMLESSTIDASKFINFVEGNCSPDRRWVAIPFEDKINLIDTAIRNTPREKAFRESRARPKPAWHTEQAKVLESRSDWYAVAFHRAWLMKFNPSDGWAFDDLHEAHRKLLARNNGQAPPLASIVSEMLKLPRGSELPQLTDESAQRLNSEFWDLVKTPAVDESARVSAWHAQRMQDVCSRFSQVTYCNTLGAIQYRLGQYDPAIESLRKSLETKASETEPSGPHPIALAFLTLCHRHVGHIDEVAQFRQQLNETMKQVMWVLNPELQAILLEVQSTLDGPDSVNPVASVEDFEREGTFDGLAQHRWRFSDASVASSFAVSFDNPHSDKMCIQAQGSYGPVMAHQTVAVIPNSKYRLTGWIRTQLEVPAAAEPQPAAEASGTETQNAAEAPASPTEELTVPSTTLVGACFAIVDREETSEIVTGTNDWKQVTWEFTTGDETTITLGCRLGMPDQVCSGTACFDDLKLEKVE